MRQPAGGGARGADHPGEARAGAPAPAAIPGGGIVDLGLVLVVALAMALVALVAFGPQLAAILDFIGAQVQQPA